MTAYVVEMQRNALWQRCPNDGRCSKQGGTENGNHRCGLASGDIFCRRMQALVYAANR